MSWIIALLPTYLSSPSRLPRADLGAGLRLRHLLSAAMLIVVKTLQSLPDLIIFQGVADETRLPFLFGVGENLCFGAAI